MPDKDSWKGKAIVAVGIYCDQCGREMGMREGGSLHGVYYVCQHCERACYFKWEVGFYPLADEEREDQE